MRKLGAKLTHIANRQGSSRAAGLLRIGIAALALVRWGEDVALFNADSPGLLILSPLFFIFAIAMLAGFRTKTATFGLTLVLGVFYFLYGHALGMAEWAHHHTYILLIATALLNASPCEKSYSVDRWLALQRAHRRGLIPPPERGYLWGQDLIVIQMAALYFWTAIDKTEWGFLSGDRLERIFEWTYAGHPLYPLMTVKPLLAIASLAVVVIEYYLAYAVLARKWKCATMGIAISLHLLFFFMLKVDTYSATMIVLYLAYLNPDRLHNMLDEIQGVKVHPTDRAIPSNDVAKAA